MQTPRTRWWAAAVLCLAAAAPFLQTLRHDLVWDDVYLVGDVAALAAKGGLAAVVSAPFLPEQNEPDNYYRPLVLASLWLDRLVGHGSPFPYHLTNVLVHVLNSLLVGWLLRDLLESAAGATAGALFFAVYPVQVEAVSFVAARTDLFATLFVLLATAGWLVARRSTAPTRPVTIALSAACYLLGSLSKETTALLPAVLLVLDLWLRREVPGHRLWFARNRAWLGAYTAAAGVLVLLRRHALGAVLLSNTDTAAAQGPLLFEEPFTALAGAVRMLRLLVVPWPLNSMYTREYMAIDAVSALAALFVVGAAATLATRRWNGVGIVAGTWIGVFLLPALLVPSGSATLIAERYLYLPMVGLVLLLGAAVAFCATCRKPVPGVAWTTTTVLVLAMGVGSFSRARVWRSDLDLTTDQVKTSPRSAFAHDLHGQALLKRQRWEDALASFQRAVALEPDGGYQNDLGIAWRRVGRPDLAVEAFRAALRLEPAAVGTRLNLAYACITLRDSACLEEQREALKRLDPSAQATLEREMVRWGFEPGGVQ